MESLSNLFSVLFVFGLLLSGYMSTPQPLTDRNSQLTQGNVQLSMQVGTTTKVQVLESFGSPNLKRWKW